MIRRFKLQHISISKQEVENNINIPRDMHSDMVWIQSNCVFTFCNITIHVLTVSGDWYEHDEKFEKSYELLL